MANQNTCMISPPFSHYDACCRRSSHISPTCAWIVINFNVTAMSKTPGKTKQNTARSILSNDTCLRSRPNRISTHFVRRASVKCQYSTGPTSPGSRRCSHTVLETQRSQTGGILASILRRGCLHRFGAVFYAITRGCYITHTPIDRKNVSESIGTYH